MGIYYNRELVSQVPTRWSTLSEILKKTDSTPETPTVNLDPSTLTTTTSSVQNPPEELPAFTDMGYGCETPASADIIALLIAQKK